MVIVEIDGQEYRLRGRIALIVGWLISRRQQIESPRKLSLAFDCAGSTVSAEVRRREQVDAALLR